MLIGIHPDNPDPRKMRQAVEVLERGGIVIYPTDGVYSMGCSLERYKTFEKVARLQGKKPEKANFSVVFYDLGQISAYTKPMNSTVFKALKKALPGPYTFILEASGQVPKIFKAKRRTIGIRIPDNNIARELVKMLGAPLIASSVHAEDEILEYITDPELIHEKYGHQVDLVIDGGMGTLDASTVVDCSGGDLEVIREGKGEVFW